MAVESLLQIIVESRDLQNAGLCFAYLNWALHQ